MPPDAVDLDSDPELRIGEIHSDVGGTRDRDDVLSDRPGKIEETDHSDDVRFNDALGGSPQRFPFLDELSEHCRTWGSSAA
jgi:hypothetical protein